MSATAANRRRQHQQNFKQLNVTWVLYIKIVTPQIVKAWVRIFFSSFISFSHPLVWPMAWRDLLIKWKTEKEKSEIAL